ncbi:MAG: glycosyltransferase [Syntrophaceae bacterium]|nr:glycosyltransferase [Syntrophaceae bacterium]
MQLPLVTVIIPAHNHSKYIEECIDSVLSQEYSSIDLIVIDDGSSDGTDCRIREILRRNPSSFRFLSRENRGLVATLNEGLKIARGNFICELASDDLLLQGSLEKRVDYLLKHPEIGVVFADAYHLFGPSRTKMRLNNGKTGFRSDTHSLSDLLSGKARMLFATGLFRKEVINGIGGFDEDFRYFEDIAIKFHLPLSTQVGYLDEPVMYYRKHGSNTSALQKLAVRREKILALEKMLHLKPVGSVPVIKNELSNEYRRYLKFAIYHAVNAREHAAVFRKARSLSPLSLRTWFYGILGPRKACK